jgi:hypothetical protein
MKNLNKIVLGILFAAMPAFAMAQVATGTISTPTHISPADNAVLKTVNFTNADWTDVISGTSTISYNYESSLSTTTKADGSFLTPAFVSGNLASSSIPTTGSAEGVYYWHVRAVNLSASTTSTSTATSSAWSTAWKVTVDNTAPSVPTGVVLTSSIAPVSTTTLGTQSWSFGTSTDNLSGIARYEYSVNGTSTWINNLLNTTFTTNLGIGSHTLLLRSIDRAENVSTSSVTLFTVTASTTNATTTPVVNGPTNKNQCKNGGWRNFTNPTFRNKGKCTSFVEKFLKDKKKEEKRLKENREREEKRLKKESRDREDRDEDDNRGRGRGGERERN